MLQFCNIFVKDDFGMTRHQRHEIIKYIRSRLPIFLAQCHQLLQNIQCILSNLTDDEKTELVVYLVPEVYIHGHTALPSVQIKLFILIANDYTIFTDQNFIRISYRCC